MKVIYCLMILLWPLVSIAQTVKPLSIGDTVPDITLTNVYNYPASTIHLSDLKEKLVILDFWATWCGSCIQTFPEMHDLKKEFRDKLQLLFIDRDTNETAEKVSSFFKRRKLRTGKSFAFPYTLDDTILIKFFPNKSIPHYVWLDSSLSVVAITGAEEITSANIRQFFSRIKLSLPIKDETLAYDGQKALLIDGNGGPPGDFIYRSILTRYKDGLGMTIGKTQGKDKKITKMFIINYPLFSIFQIAYPEILRYPVNRTFINVKDSLLYRRTKDELNRNLFCYELIVPPASEEEVLKYLRCDLSRNFHAVAHNEKRRIKCYVLSVNKYVSKSIAKGGHSSKDTDKESLHKYFKNTPISDLAIFLNILLDKPVVDETGLNQNIDIEFPTDLYSYNEEKLSSFLSMHGFTLTAASRVMEVAVVSESKE
jgi:thiol-disulfide isomerase/thioredoxin